MSDLFPALPPHTSAYREGVAQQLKTLAEELEEASDDSDALVPGGSLVRAFERVMATLKVPVDTWISLSEPGSATPGLLRFWVARVGSTLSQVDALGENLARMVSAVTEALTAGARAHADYRQARDELLEHSLQSKSPAAQALASILEWPNVGPAWRAARHQERLNETCLPSALPRKNPRM